MKRILFILLGLFVGFSTVRADQKSEALLNKLRGQIRSYTSYRIHLTGTVEGEGSVRGTITISGLKFAAKMLGQELYYDGSTIWNYIPSEGEVIIEKLNSQQALGSALANPTKLLNVNPDDYHHRMLPSVRDPRTSKDLQVVELVPKESVADYTALTLYIDPSTTLPTRISIHSPYADTPIELVINKIENNFPVKMEDFQFDVNAHRGVEVIDFR